MEVFKVVRRVADRLVSVSTPYGEVFSLEYGPGVVTYPPADWPMAWPFAFRNEGFARRFYDEEGIEGQDWEIWSARASSVRCDSKVSAVLDQEFIEAFWQGTDTDWWTPSPEGSIACSSIELIRRVWP